MSVDLERSLNDLARSVGDDGAAQRMSGQVHLMAGRIRRRRATRHAANGVVGLGAAAAVTFGGLQLAQRDDSTAPPAAREDPGSVACGALLADPASDPGAAVSLVLEVQEAGVGTAPVTVPDPAVGAEVSVSFAGAVDEIVDVVGEPQMALTLDGVVVSLPAQVADVAESMPPIFGLRQPLLACDPATAGQPLPPGGYEIVAWQTVQLATGGAVQLSGRTSLLIAGQETAVPEPTPADEPVPDVDGVGSEAQAALEALLAQAPSPNQFPACASALLPLDDPLLTFDLTLEDRPYASGEQLTGEVTLLSTGGRTVLGNAPTSGAVLVLTQAGVVVGRDFRDPEDVDLVGVGPDDARAVPLSGSMSLCSVPVTATPALGLPPGAYEAYAVMEVMIKEVVEADGEALSITQGVVVRSNAVPVTVE